MSGETGRIKSAVETAIGFVVLACVVYYFWPQIVGNRAAQASTQTATAPVSHFPKKMECARLANEERDREKRSASDGFFMDAEQCYVPSMDTCIFENNFLGHSGFATRSVIDLTTGHVLASYDNVGPDQNEKVARMQEFKTERNRLFGQCAK